MQEELKTIALNDIKVKKNTRKNFDEAALKELAQSIKKNGVLQPILVRKNGTKDSYELICGERRYRASLACGLVTIPAKIVEASDRDVLKFQIVENMQRKSINPMDEALAVKRLRDEFSMTFAEIGNHLGKSETHVHAQMSLATATKELQAALKNNWITRVVALAVAKLQNREKQIEAVNGLSRKNGGYLVTIQKAQEFINHLTGAVPRKAAAKKFKSNVFYSDWKYYLARFSCEQFEQWKGIVRGRTETEIFAEAVEAVMRESQNPTE